MLAAGVPSRWLEGKGVAIKGLRTPNGQLTYALSRSDKQLLLEVSAGLVPPHGGVILPWPYSGDPGDTRVNGEPAHWINGELRITQVPATVEIEVPSAIRRAERKAQ
ncbi:hypothetical protein D3C71_1718550 [compost metagenome]